MCSTLNNILRSLTLLRRPRPLKAFLWINKDMWSDIHCRKSPLMVLCFIENTLQRQSQNREEQWEAVHIIPMRDAKGQKWGCNNEKWQKEKRGRCCWGGELTWSEGWFHMGIDRKSSAGGNSKVQSSGSLVNGGAIPLGRWGRMDATFSGKAVLGPFWALESRWNNTKRTRSCPYESPNEIWKVHTKRKLKCMKLHNF